jgi:hypothetical protein
MYVEIPYTGLSTFSFKKKLSRISGQVRPNLDVRFYTKPPPSVQTYFNLKDPIPKYLQADVVYSVNCIDSKNMVHQTQYFSNKTRIQILMEIT